jgi:hypothetical protein
LCQNWTLIGQNYTTDKNSPNLRTNVHYSPNLIYALLKMTIMKNIHTIGAHTYLQTYVCTISLEKVTHTSLTSMIKLFLVTVCSKNFLFAWNFHSKINFYVRFRFRRLPCVDSKARNCAEKLKINTGEKKLVRKSFPLLPIRRNFRQKIVPCLRNLISSRTLQTRVARFFLGTWYQNGG